MEIIMTTYNDDDVNVAPNTAHDVSVAPNTADDIQPETVSETATKLEKPPSTDHFASPLLIPENTPQPSPQITAKSEFQTNGSEQAVGDEQEDAYNYGIQLPPNKKLKSSPISEVQPVKHEVQPEQDPSQNLEEIAAASTFESASESISKKRKSSPISDVQPEVQPEHDLSPHLEEIALPEEIATASTFESASESKSKKLKLSPISDVQALKPEVQSEHDLSPHIEIASPEEIATASTLESASDPKNKKLKSSPISDVQPVKPEVQPEDDLSQNLEEIATPERTDTPEEIATPSTAKLSSKSKSKKLKKKSNNNVWARPTSRKGKKKPKANCNNGNQTNTPAEDDKVLILPIPKFPDKTDDNPELSICLSKFYKAEKVEISEDRLSAGSTKGYRMVRATRGVVEGAWYFEIKVMHLGETGHTRLGWSTVKGDLQAPVGFDANSFGYRDVDGSKVHKALREVYGQEGYGEGDVIGFYINLPDGSLFEPKPPRYVWFKGQRYVAPDDEDPPKVVPGSEVCFFKNGICQGTAFTDLFGGRYFPAASMYTLPNQSNCLVKFNFGPDFDSFPGDFGGRQLPRPMIEVPYHGCDGRVENGSASLWNSPRTSTMLKVTKEQGTLFVGAAELDID